MFSFFIPVCIKNDLHFKQLRRCIDSIRKYHNDNPIFLIDDSDSSYNIISNYKNIVIIKSLNKGSADQQIFKIFLENDTNDRCVFIQDSMILNKKLDNIDNINGVKFIWHFTNHIIDWDNIEEEKTEYNIKNNIICHTDLITHFLLKDYNENMDFLEYALKMLKDKNKWCGCFGNCCIIDRKTVEYMNNTVNFIDKFVKCTSNRERRMNETIFSLISHYLFRETEFQKSYDGLYYDGININPYNGLNTGFDGLYWCCKKEYFSKISFQR